MKAFINIIGDIGKGYFNEKDAQIVELVDVITQVEQNKDASIYHFKINSPGGLVEEGDKIFDYISSLKAKGKIIITEATNECASIATKLFLAGTTRIINSDCFFMIHNPWGGNMGDADEMIEYGKDLKKIETKLLNEYIQLTGSSLEALSPLMKQETILSPEQAVQLGFATEIATIGHKAVAYTSKFNNKNPKMAKEAITKKEAQSMFAKFANDLKGIFKSMKVTALMLTSSTGQEIEFPDVEAGESPAVGDSAMLEGSPIPDGEYTIENDVYVCKDGKVETITEGEEGDDDGEEMTALKEENATLTQHVQELTGQVSSLKTENKTAVASVKKLQKNFEKLSSLAGNFDFEGKKKKKKEGAKAKNKGERETRSILKEKE